MRNITALEFARLYSDLLLVEVLPRAEVAAKLREMADMIDSNRMRLHEAYSMEAVHEKTVATTTLILHFYQQNPSRSDDFTEQEMEIFSAMGLGLRCGLGRRILEKICRRQQVKADTLREYEQRITKRLSSQA